MELEVQVWIKALHTATREFKIDGRERRPDSLIGDPLPEDILITEIVNKRLLYLFANLASCFMRIIK